MAAGIRTLARNPLVRRSPRFLLAAAMAAALFFPGTCPAKDSDGPAAIRGKFKGTVSATVVAFGFPDTYPGTCGTKLVIKKGGKSGNLNIQIVFTYPLGELVNATFSVKFKNGKGTAQLTHSFLGGGIDFFTDPPPFPVKVKVAKNGKITVDGLFTAVGSPCTLHMVASTKGGGKKLKGSGGISCADVQATASFSGKSRKK